MDLVKKTSLLILVAVTLIFAAYGGDTASVQINGFSEDGRYVSFQMTGVADGSGFPYLFFGIYDCREHKWARKPFFEAVEIMDEKDYEKGTFIVEEKLGDLIVGLHAKYSIATFQQGLPVMERAPYSPAVTALGISDNGRDIIVKLKEIPGSKTLYDMYTPSGYEISVSTATNDTVIEKKDPATDFDGALWDLSMESARMFKDTLVIIVSYKSPGFEGPNTRYFPIGVILDPVTDESK